MSDFANGIFEFIGSLFVWLNFVTIYKDKGYMGVHWGPAVFFQAWGVWNLFFYPHLNQFWSLMGGISMVVANTFWLAAMIIFGRIKNE